MSAQEVTLDRYQLFMQINAQAHLLRAGRKAGIIDTLREGQATADQIISRLGTEPRMTHLLLDSLVAMQVLEKYGDDYALAAVTRLLCQYDSDLGDVIWERLDPKASDRDAGSTVDYFDAMAATQWVHTAAAKQAAEILDIGGERSGRHILDLGCGSAVWSAAMAFADESATVTAIDTPSRIEAARKTIDSIGLGPRYELIEAEPNDVTLTDQTYDLALVAGRISGYAPQHDAAMIRRIGKALKPGGELVVIDLFRGPNAPGVNESIESLRLALQTPEGHIRDAQTMRMLVTENGFGACQFAFIAASRQGWGLLLAVKQQQSQ
jgi:ubiquinone/menaquinone biosynthesis C-methylase UbiE